MERRLTEERITRTMLAWLKGKDWIIVTYDYPQSGTGYSLLSANRDSGSKNNGVIIPDIVAVRNGAVLFFENKVQFSMVDVEAIQLLRDTHLYDASISLLLREYEPINKIRFGFALKNSPSNLKKLTENRPAFDFAFLVNQELGVDLAFGQLS